MDNELKKQILEINADLILFIIKKLYFYLFELCIQFNL